LIASIRPTKFIVWAIGFRSTLVVPTGTASGADCCANAEATTLQTMRVAKMAIRISGFLSVMEVVGELAWQTVKAE
jgi:hypothetical protein